MIDDKLAIADSAVRAKLPTGTCRNRVCGSPVRSPMTAMSRAKSQNWKTGKLVGARPENGVILYGPVGNELAIWDEKRVPVSGHAAADLHGRARRIARVLMRSWPTSLQSGIGIAQELRIYSRRRLPRSRRAAIDRRRLRLQALGR